MGIDRPERLERRADRAVTIWVGFGSAVLAGLLGLGGVALGSLIAADEAQKAIAVQRELAAREDLISATSEFDGAIQTQYSAALDITTCLSNIAAGSATPCREERLAYGSAWVDTRAAFAKVNYFAPADVLAAATELVEGMPAPTGVSDTAMAEGFEGAMHEYEYLQSRGLFVEALCLTINPYSDACGDGEAVNSIGW